MNEQLLRASWPSERLGECLTALAKRAHLSDGQQPPELPCQVIDPASYVERAAERLACEATVLQTSLGSLETALLAAVPSVLQWTPGQFVAMVGRRGHSLELLTSDLGRQRVPVRSLCQAIREPFEAPHRDKLKATFASMEIGSRLDAALDAVLLDRIAELPFRDAWTLRPASGAPLGIWLRQAAVLRNFASLLGVHLAQYAVWLLAWTVLGSMSLSGRVDSGKLLGWALLLVTAVPFQLLTSWLQGQVAVGAGGLLKKRLLAGALKLRPDEVRTCGIGAFLAQALEAETVEQLALGGGVGGLLALLDLAVSAFVLGPHALVLAFWFIFLVFFGFRFFHAFARWSDSRFKLTQLTTEAMLGHRTRISQQHPADWHRAEDRALDDYQHRSQDLDRAAGVLIGFLPRGWLVLGLASTVPVLLAGSASATTTAALIGGVLLAFNAFSQLALSFPDLAAIAVGWRWVSTLFAAASRPDASGVLLETPDAPPHANVLEADRVMFRYRTSGSPVLDGCSVAIRPKDRVLLEGPSGGGKTTLASVLSGIREAESGLLLAGGLDKATVSQAGWSDRVVSVPQFHENHILTESLAFNLLMGRTWPPSASELREADEVCRRLGLGELLDRMPNGVMQMVGEGGWQLSHGEKSRIYMARALLQNSQLLILDESFGALDPENMQRSLEYTLEHANALMVIAHP